MKQCVLCEEQVKKKWSGKPHHDLLKADAPRVFKGAKSRSYEEQDYQCQVCRTKFTHSTNKNDLAWTLWQG